MNSKDNYISIAKAIAIILMVVAHAMPPEKIIRFISLFHMPLFFFYSGYFLKISNNTEGLKLFIKKRVKGLYFPYIKWSLFFLLTHNIFYRIGIYNSDYVYYNVHQSLYEIKDFILHAIMIIFTMDYHEQLLGGFWFLKTLFLSSLLVSFLMFTTRRFNKNTAIVLWIILWVTTILLRKSNISLPIFGRAYLITFGSLFYISGYLYHIYEEKLNLINRGWIFSLLLLILIAIYYPGSLSMTSLSASSVFIYPIFAFLGISFIAYISRILNNTQMRFSLYYIGQHTMPILALHMLAFKIVNLIKIWHYGMKPEQLAEFPVIQNNNEIYWILYAIVAICLPLLANKLYNMIIYKLNKKCLK